MHYQSWEYSNFFHLLSFLFLAFPFVLVYFLFHNQTVLWLRFSFYSMYFNEIGNTTIVITLLKHQWSIKEHLSSIDSPWLILSILWPHKSGKWIRKQCCIFDGGKSQKRKFQLTYRWTISNCAFSNFSTFQTFFATKVRDIHTESSKQFKWNLYFYGFGQKGPFWAELKLL